MCAQFGVLVSYSQAYSHQSNGSAERAGSSLIGLIRKKFADDRLSNWLDLMHSALVQNSDVPNLSGLTPYQCVTGRGRVAKWIPYTVDREAFDASEFITNMQESHKWMRHQLLVQRAKNLEMVNKHRREKDVLMEGDLVWTEVPRNPIGLIVGTKIDVKWFGPRRVTARLGKHSYYVTTDAKGSLKQYHRDQLKPYHHDVLTGKSLPLHYFAPSRSKAIEIGEQDEGSWEVESIQDVRKRGGKLEYLSKWKGFVNSTWETAGSFVTEPWEVFGCTSRQDS